jgi:hypothetical protein
MEELLGRVAGQLDLVIDRQETQSKILHTQAKQIAALETALEMKGKEGDREHDQIRRRLEEGDKELNELGRGKGNHSDRLGQIEKKLEAASVRRWDVAQIVISAVVGLVVSGTTTAVAYLWMLHKLAAAAAKGAP